MSDPFQPINKKLLITNQVIDACNEFGISILFSTKSDDLHNANIKPDLHSFQFSVSNVENRKDIEPNVPDISKRIELFKQLKREGFKIGIRIQPFIPDVSNLEIIKLFEGADHFTIEGLKIISQNKEQKEYVYDYLKIPSSYFTQMGLLNLKPEIRYEYYKPIIKYLESHHISYSIADNDMRWLSNNRCCCGDNLIKKATEFNTTTMIKKHGMEYTIDDLLSEADHNNCLDCNCGHLMTSNRINHRDNVENFLIYNFSDKRNPASILYQYYPRQTLF